MSRRQTGAVEDQPRVDALLLGNPGESRLPLDEADADGLSLFHRLFDKLYPLIRFVYERLQGHDWFTEIEPGIWLGGAPTYGRDYEFLRVQGITAVLDVRAERPDETAFYDRYGIAHVRFRVPDIAVPDDAVITAAVNWLAEQLTAGRVVLVHCAKGRGRSATLLAGYLMRERGMSFEAARELLKSKRALAKLEDRHRQRLTQWLAGQRSRERAESAELSSLPPGHLTGQESPPGAPEGGCPCLRQ